MPSKHNANTCYGYGSSEERQPTQANVVLTLNVSLGTNSFFKYPTSQWNVLTMHYQYQNCHTNLNLPERHCVSYKRLLLIKTAETDDTASKTDSWGPFTADCQQEILNQ